MKRTSAALLLAPLLLPSLTGVGASPAQAAEVSAVKPKPSSCTPSPTVLHAAPAPVKGLTSAQVRTAVAVINAAAQAKVPQRGQTLAVMTSLEETGLGRSSGGSSTPLGSEPQLQSAGSDPAKAAGVFYGQLKQVKNWTNLPPSLAAHAAQHNLDPGAYAAYWARATSIVDSLTAGTGAAGLQNLAARAQAVADCTAASVGGVFANGTKYVGPLPPDVLVNRAEDLAKNGGNVWHDRCQAFVAILDGRASSGYATALDAWQTFLAQGVAHPVTGPDGVAPPVGAWLYYSSGNPAGHVDTYLGQGQVTSTDVFANGRVGVGPASALTNGPWRLQYLGWAAPWGQQ